MKVDPELAATVAAVIDEGTLDAAARHLHLTPSAVSQRIKALEEALGQRLVVRSKPARATEAGLAIVRYARRAALLEHDVVEDLGLTETGPRPRLSIAVNADSLATWFLEPLGAFTAEHDVEVDLHRHDQIHTARLLEEGTVAAAITSEAEPVPGCCTTPLGGQQYEAVAAPDWLERWAPDGVDAEVLARAPRLDYDRHDSLHASWLAHFGVDAQQAPRHLIPSNHDIARGIELGLGWGVVPVHQSAPLIAAGRLVPLDGPRISIDLYWQRWKGASGLLDALTEHVVAAGTNLLTS